MSESPITSKLAQSSWLRLDLTRADDQTRQRLEGMEGWQCFAMGTRSYSDWLPPSPEGSVWVEIPGAHGLDWCQVENYACVPADALVEGEIDMQPYTDADRSTAENSLHKRLGRGAEGLPLAAAADAQIFVDIEGLRGHAGILLVDDAAPTMYHWNYAGTSYRRTSDRGVWMPLSGRISEQLHRWGDNIFCNDGRLDVDLLNGLLAEHASGWRVAAEYVPLSDEAHVWVTCEAEDEFDEQARREMCFDDALADRSVLTGKLGLLVWGNSD